MENLRSFYDLVLRKHIETKGCVAPYHMPHDSFLLCHNETEMKAYKYDWKKVRRSYYPPACHRISKMGFILSHQLVADDLFGIYIQYPENLKIIQQSKEVDIHSLIGNCGGYVGLFLGNKYVYFTIVC